MKAHKSSLTSIEELFFCLKSKDLMKGFMRRAFALAMASGFAFTPSLWAVPSGNVPVTGSPVVKSPEVGICSLDAPNSPCNKKPATTLRTGDGNEVGICQVGAGGPCNESPITQPTPDPTTPTPPAQPQLKISSCLYNIKTGKASGCGPINLGPVSLKNFQDHPLQPSSTLTNQASAIAEARGVSSQNIKIIGYIKMGAKDRMKIVFTEGEPQFYQIFAIIVEGIESGKHYKTTIVMDKDGKPVEAKQVFDDGTTRVYGNLVKQVKVYKNLSGMKLLYDSTMFANSKGLPTWIFGKLIQTIQRITLNGENADYNKKEKTLVVYNPSGNVSVRYRDVEGFSTYPMADRVKADQKAIKKLLNKGAVKIGVSYPAPGVSEGTILYGFLVP